MLDPLGVLAAVSAVAAKQSLQDCLQQAAGRVLLAERLRGSLYGADCCCRYCSDGFAEVETAAGGVTWKWRERDLVLLLLFQECCDLCAEACVLHSQSCCLRALCGGDAVYVCGRVLDRQGGVQ